MRRGSTGSPPSASPACCWFPPLLLARETKELLIGSRRARTCGTQILRIAAADRDVRNANGVITVQLGPHRIVAALSIEFRPELTAAQIESCVERIEAAIQNPMPEVTSVFLKPQKAATWSNRRGRLKTDPSEE